MLNNNTKISTPRHTNKSTNDYQYLGDIEEYITRLIDSHNEDIKYKDLIDSESINDDDILIELEKAKIETISNKICDIKEIYLKKNTSNIFFDEDAINKVFLFMLVSIKYHKLINRFRRENNKDFQPLKPYLNCITNILEKTNNKDLKSELQKEYDFISNIKELHARYTKDDELYSILIDHNKLIKSAKDRLPISGAIPVAELNIKKIKTLSNFIDKQVSSSSSFH